LRDKYFGCDLNTYDETQIFQKKSSFSAVKDWGFRLLSPAGVGQNNNNNNNNNNNDDMKNPPNNNHRFPPGLSQNLFSVPGSSIPKSLGSKKKRQTTIPSRYC